MRDAMVTKNVTCPIVGNIVEQKSESTPPTGTDVTDGGVVVTNGGIPVTST